MRKCPACGADYEVTDLICPACDADLPAPYETADGDEDYFVDEREEETDREAEEGQFHFSDTNVWRIAGQVEYPPSMITILSGAEVFLEEDTLATGSVMIAQGRIVAVMNEAVPDPEDGSTFIDLTGKVLAPGFIDVHVHGMMGIDTNEASAEDFARFSAEAAKRGTTALVPTTVACSTADLSQVLINLHQARTSGVPGARLLGLHMESNFINPQFKGAQPPEQIFSPNDEKAWPIRKLIDEYAQDIRILTVAPEVPGVLDLIPWLRERNIIASMGHSAATYEEASAGVDAGITHATHLFNAMTPLHHRNPGMVGAALERDEVFTEIICDGIHVHPAVLSTVFSAKSADRVMAVTDGLRGAGMAAGEFTLGGQHVTVQGGVARLDDGTIAGSITTMDAIIRLLVEQVGWDLGEAILMATSTPANGLGLPQLGRIAPQAAADLVVLDEQLQVELTIVGGQIVYQR